MVTVRYRIEVLRDRVGDHELEISLGERWAEGEVPVAPDGPPPASPLVPAGAPAEESP
jgi:hypothetical protein